MIKYLLSIIFVVVAGAIAYFAYANWALLTVVPANFGYNGQQDYYLYVVDTRSHDYRLDQTGLQLQMVSVASAAITTFKFPDKQSADNVLLDWGKAKSGNDFTLSPPSYCKYIYLFVPSNAANIGDSVYDSDYFFQCRAELPSSQLKNLSLTGI